MYGYYTGLETTESAPGVAAGPAIVRTHLNHGLSAAASVVIAVTTTVPNSWLLTSVSCRRNATNATAITCTDDGGHTWTEATPQADVFSVNGLRHALFKTKITTIGTFNITAASASNTSMGISTEQFVNALDDLTNVSPMATHLTGDPTVALPVAALGNSMVYGSYACSGGSTVTIPTNFTEIQLIAPSGSRLETCFIESAVSGGSWGSAGIEAAACMIELKKIP